MRHSWICLMVLVVLVVLSSVYVAPIQSQDAIPPGETQTAVATRAATGDAGTSLYVSGNSYVAVPHAAVPTLGANWTVEAWVYPVTTTNCRAVVGKNAAEGFWFGLCGGFIRFHRGTATFVQSDVAVPVNRWTHIAVSTFYEGYADEYYAEMFINGESLGYYGLTGNGAVGGTRELRIGDDQPWDYFIGDIAEVRLWNYDQGEIGLRRFMNSMPDEKPAGLVANWHLTGDTIDSISGVEGTLVGNGGFVGYVSPVLPPTTPVDEFFNVLPQPLYGAGSAYVPRLNRAILVGGYRAGAPSSIITAVDVASGATSALGTLPAVTGLPVAAYASANDTVYVFGGSTDTTDTTIDTISAINPETGVVRTLAATLPQSLYIASVVYHPKLNKMVVLGGYRLPEGALNTVYVFDVASETISTAGFSLPQAVYGAPAVYSGATGNIYLFGGTNGTDVFDAVLEIALQPNGTDGTITPLAARMPKADARTVAFEDPTTRMIYVAGGSATTRVLAFDPQTGELWRTPLEMPKDVANTAEAYYPAPASKIKPYASAVYSPRNRHALVLGGGVFGGNGTTTVWRIPLGDGPLVQLGKWDFKGFATGSITALDGAERALLVGMNAGAWQFYNYGFDALPSERYFNLGETSVVRWDPYGSRPYFAANNRVYLGWPNGATTQVHDAGWPVLDIEPTGSDTPPMFGVDTVNRDFTKVPSWFAALGSLSSYTYAQYGPNCSKTTSIRYKGISNFYYTDYWGITMPVLACTGQRPAQNTADADSPQTITTDLPPHFYRLRTTAAGSWSSADLGLVCDTNVFTGRKMEFGTNGDLWVAGKGGVCRYPRNSLPGNAASAFNVFNLPYATASNNVSVDADGRVWFSTDGGLSVFEVRRDANVPVATLRASDFNRLNAPIGAANGSSGLDSLVAVGEKVFAGRETSDVLFSYANRWNQLNPGVVVKKLWTVRGRLFAATATTLQSLQPDGVTWIQHPAVVHDVAQDRDGHIWVAHDGGVQWWTPDGVWQSIPGLSLAEPVTALALDQTGRMWLGLNNGVALYDRNRLVTRITPPTGAIATTKLLVDRDNNVWAATVAGLARFNVADATWSAFTSGSGMPYFDDNVVDLVEHPDGTLFASTTKSVLRSAPDVLAWTNVSVDDNVPLATDELGRVWAGNSVETRPNTWQWYGWTNSGIRSGHVSDVAADQSDRVWLAHPTGGISVRGSFLPPLADEVPAITSISPKNASNGDTITIAGSGFGTDVSAVSVDIGGVAVPVQSASSTSLTVRISPDTTSGNVSVRRGKRKTTFGGATPAFCAIPRITSVSPTGTNIGATVVITGTNFDPRATVQIGSGTPRSWVISPRSTRTTVEAGDTSGNLVVHNVCAGATATRSDFRRFTLTISRSQLNQGYVGFPLSAGNATLASAFLSVDQPLRATDRLHLDRFSVQLGQVGAVNRQFFEEPISGAIPSSTGVPAEGVYRDLANAVNMPNVVYYGSGNTAVTMELKANGRTAAATTFEQTFAPASRGQVLLVPLVPAGLNGDQINAFKASVDANLADYRYRIYPGGMVPVWSGELIRTETLSSDGRIDLGDADQFNRATLAMEQIRKRYNNGRSDKVAVAFGVVDPTVVIGNAGGLGNLGQLPQWRARQECEDSFIHDVINFLTTSDCGPEFPQFRGWGIGNSLVSRYTAHEIGHMMGMVQTSAANYANFGGSGGDSHSATSELSIDGKPTDCPGGDDPYTNLDANRTLVRQAGVAEPIVNPITGHQYKGALDNKPESGPERGKGLLSYACDRNGQNTFFEPSDLNFMRAQRYGSIRPFYEPRPAAQRRSVAQNEPDRLHVAGVVTPTDTLTTGAIWQVEYKDQTAKVSADYQMGYELVQYNVAGTALERWGVLPVFPGDSNQQHTEHRPDATHHDHQTKSGVFSASILKAAGVVRVDLVHAGTTLATWTGGATPPSVSISSPAGGETFTSGDVPVAWSVSDADGDVLAVSVQWSADDGGSWTPVASAKGSGSTTIPVALLSGSTAARLRVWVSDGLNEATATSEVFTVAHQPPQPVIVAPVAGSTFLEAQTVSLLGWASDPQDGTLRDADHLVWTSDHDGVLGRGESVYTLLSVGLHTITLQATNSAGLVGTTSVEVEIAPDYDGDGFVDSDEEASGLNVLTSNDALSDADGDGLSYRVERGRGTDPNNADSDGDGRSDTDELADGSDPLTADTLQPDVLHVWPLSMTFDIDLSEDIQLPQQTLEAFSRSLSAVTVTTDVPWLDVSTTTGTTPFVSTVVLNPILLAGGTQTGTITVASDRGTVVVPITVNVANKADFCDVDRNGTGNAADIAAVQARIGSRLGDANYDYHYDVDRNGSITTTDVQLLSSCIGAIIPPQSIYLPIIQR